MRPAPAYSRRPAILTSQLPIPLRCCSYVPTKIILSVTQPFETSSARYNCLLHWHFNHIDPAVGLHQLRVLLRPLILLQ